MRPGHTSMRPAPRHVIRNTLCSVLVLLAGLSAFGQTTSAPRNDIYTDVSKMHKAGKLTEAEATADKYLADHPRDPQMRYLKGVIQRDSGRLPDALETFTRLTEDYPELPEPYNSVAVIEASLGHLDKARLALEGALRANPAYATAHENLGDVYFRLATQSYCKSLQYAAGNSDLKSRLQTRGIACP